MQPSPDQITLDRCEYSADRGMVIIPPDLEFEWEDVDSARRIDIPGRERALLVSIEDVSAARAAHEAECPRLGWAD